MAERTNYLTREIPACNLEGLADRIAELNKRAARLSVAPMVLSVIDSREDTEIDPDTGLESVSRYVTVSLEGDSPVLDGWRLIARVTPAEDGLPGNFTKAVPGLSCPPEFRTVSMGRCDHCHVNRPRNDTFVVRHASGEHKVVGRNCLADFLGHDSPETLLGAAELAWKAAELFEGGGDSDGEGGGFGFGRATAIGIEKFLGTVSIFIRSLGWLSRGNAGEGFATADRVWGFLINPKRTPADREFIDSNSLYGEPYDTELAGKALAWVRDPNFDTSSDYLYNLKLACRADWVSYHTIGLVASLIPAYKREVEREIRKARERENKRRGHVGTLKKREGFPGLTVLFTTVTDSFYGPKTVVKFENEAGDLLVWFATGDVSPDWEMGKTYDITATPKDHSEFRGEKETIISRVKEGLPPVKKSRKKKSAPEGSAA